MAAMLEKKVAVVTGGGRGIGRAVALLLAREGARVVVADYGVNVDGTAPTSAPAEDVVEEICRLGGEALPAAHDVSTMQGGEAIIRTALDGFGRLDILVNVAGILRGRMIFNMNEEEWDAVIAVHLKGHFCTIKPASVLFRQQRSGRIINFTSAAGLAGNSGQANYGAAKAGIAGLTRVVAKDLGRYGVTCNCISPGAQTRMTKSVPQTANERRAAQGIGSAMGGRSTAAPSIDQMLPEQVAPMVAYLASDEAGNINGQIFQCMGGQVALVATPLPVRSIYTKGTWEPEELAKLVPGQLMVDYVNPAPPLQAQQQTQPASRT
ncbi:MAG: SDR family NAD(P)-dependent oxidoreductase [Dehalococcoidia bacterium]